MPGSCSVFTLLCSPLRPSFAVFGAILISTTFPCCPPATCVSWLCDISLSGGVRLGPAHGSVLLCSWQKGQDFSSCGQWEEAVICYTKAISLDPQRVMRPWRDGNRRQHC